MNTVKILIAFSVIILYANTGFCQSQLFNLREKTSFQIAAPWRPEYDVRSDIAIVYGMDTIFNESVKSKKLLSN